MLRDASRTMVCKALHIDRSGKEYLLRNQGMRAFPGRPRYTSLDRHDKDKTRGLESNSIQCIVL